MQVAGGTPHTHSMVHSLRLVTVLALALAPQASAGVVFSAGFTSDCVLQRAAASAAGSSSGGVRVYGFANSSAKVTVAVEGSDAKGSAVSYSVDAAVERWDGAAIVNPDTPAEPEHGGYTWWATLRAASAGGEYSITADDGSPNATRLDRVTFGDVFFCSGQSNMALETFYTFSADTLKAEIASGQYAVLRHFMFGSMGGHYEATAPMWVSAYNTDPTDPTQRWHNVTESASHPSMDNATQRHSAFAQFSATCMYVCTKTGRSDRGGGLEREGDRR